MTIQQSCRITSALATIKAEPDENAASTSEGLYGEWVDVISMENTWRHVRLQRDGYEGFVAEHNLESIPDESVTATHIVQSRNTLLFSKPSIKSPVVMRLPFRAHLRVIDTFDESFAKTDTGHFVWLSHIAAVGTRHEFKPSQLAQSHFLALPTYGEAALLTVLIAQGLFRRWHCRRDWIYHAIPKIRSSPFPPSSIIKTEKLRICSTGPDIPAFCLTQTTCYMPLPIV